MNRKRKRLVALAVFLVVTYWAWPRASLPVPDKIISMTLYSIDGREGKSREPTQPAFQGYLILGETVLDQHCQRMILKALNRGVARHWSLGGMQCHRPRHGLRITGSNRSIDYSICFECQNIAIFDADGRVWAYTTRYPEPILNDVLTRAGIKLAPSRDSEGELAFTN